MVARMLPSRLMEADAEASLTATCAIDRSGAGAWTTLIASAPCSVRHSEREPAPEDVSEATSASAETVTVRLGHASPVRIGDRVRHLATGRTWTVGATNRTATYRSLTKARAARPTAATPRMSVVLRRYSQETRTWVARPAQEAHIVLSSSQPENAGGQGRVMQGWLFAPEDGLPLDVQVGDTFLYAGVSARIEWVPPDPVLRREAVFTVNVGEG